NGYQYIKKPNKKMMAVRLITFLKNAPLPTDSYFFMLKLMEFPTTKRKVGKTRSVRVNPCQSACSKAEKVVAPFPGELTTIIKATSNPLNTSRERYLFFNWVMVGRFY